MNSTSIPQIKIARYAMSLISDLNLYYRTPMTISRFNLVPMLSENYLFFLKTVNPDNPNYQNDDMSANAATAIISKKFLPLSLSSYFPTSATTSTLLLFFSQI
jgi:hypothetical protein